MFLLETLACRKEAHVPDIKKSEHLFYRNASNSNKLFLNRKSAELGTFKNINVNCQCTNTTQIKTLEG